MSKRMISENRASFWALAAFIVGYTLGFSQAVENDRLRARAMRELQRRMENLRRRGF